MPKLERLVKLLRLTRGREVATVREMSQACGVSQRTIYRYLRTLSQLGLPEELESDRWSSISWRGRTELDPDDWCLLSYVIDHNPLADQAFFSARLAGIRKRLRPRWCSAEGYRAGRWLEVVPQKKKSTRLAGNNLLGRYVDACKRSRRVRLRLRGRKSAVMVARPRAVRLTSDRICLVLSDATDESVLQFDLDEIGTLEPCRRRAMRRRSRSVSGRRNKS